MEAISEIGQLEGHGDFVTTAAFSPDGRFILSGSADRTMRLWEVATQHEIQRFEDHVKNTVWGVSFSPTGRRILASCLQVVQTGEAVTSFIITIRAIRTHRVNPSDARQVSACHVGTL